MAAVSQVFAGDTCEYATTSWEGAGFHQTCTFDSSSGASAEVSSYSRTDPQAPHAHQLIADLMNVTNPGNYRVYAYAQGYDRAGSPISSCITQRDTSTDQGATVGNGSGCANATTHHLFAHREQIIIR